ncbi:MAG: sigma-54 dependent transcriptional regulator [Planctomycetota bacterium]|jgi:DNA-binding NtrC family response regulator|nr:sigma-54 dependent transcriptional regulator [Planctomycetota bacterium]
MNDTQLIVDDNERVFKSLAINFRHNGFACLWAPDGATALASAAENDLAAAIFDLSLGSENGLDLMARLVELLPGLPVVFIAGYGTLEAAVAAVKMGAYDFLPKPLDFKRLLDVVRKAIDAGRSAAGNDPGGAAGRHNKTERLSVPGPPAPPGASGMVADSPAMRDLLARAARAADSDISVLVTGESGTGKELLAEFIHANSPRRGKPLVRVNCSAITDSLAESELFGHLKGAFTGADSDHPGYFEQAGGGTLHLDEIGDMPPAIQAKMLRVMENARVRPLGGTREIPVNARIVASTNRRLDEMVGAGGFRSDLYYRVNALELRLPPLRERLEDIAPLLRRFLSAQPGGGGKRFSLEAEKLLHAYAWPGNIRELRNIVKVCALLSPGSVIEAADLPYAVREGRAARASPARLDETERNAIRAVLDEVGGNRRQAARRLGISLRSLYYKLERHGLS